MTRTGIRVALAWSTIGLALLVLGWLGLVVAGLATAPFVDAEALAVQVAVRPPLGGPGPVPVDGMGWRAAAGVWIGAAGNGAAIARLPSALLGAVVLVLVAALGRRSGDARIGLVGALLLAATAPFVLAGSRASGEMAAMLAVVVMAHLVLTAGTRAGVWWPVAAAVAGAVGLWCALWAAPAVAALATVLLLARRAAGTAALAQLVPAFAVGVALLAPMALLASRPEVALGLFAADGLGAVLGSEAGPPRWVLLVVGLVALGLAALRIASAVRLGPSGLDLVLVWALVPIGAAATLTALRSVPMAAILTPALPAMALAVPILATALRPGLARVLAVAGLGAVLLGGSAAWVAALPAVDSGVIATHLGAERLPGEVVVVGPTGGSAYDDAAERLRPRLDPPPRVTGDAIPPGTTRVRVVSRSDAVGALERRLTEAGYVRVASIRTGGARIRSYQPAAVRGDVVVYGGTPGGIATAVAAAREGADVVLLLGPSPLGGMMASGLSATDVGSPSTIGGLAREVFARYGEHYGTDAFGQPVAWNPEPWVARAVFRAMLEEAGVRVFGDALLDRGRAVERAGGRLVAIATTAGMRVEGDVFVDGSYEGDLLAQAGVSWTIGREARGTYGESLAGVQPVGPALTATDRLIGTFGSTGRPLPGVEPGPLAPPGSADRLVQPYTFRLCVTRAPDRLPFPRPAGYRTSRFVLLERYLDHRTRTTGRAPTFADLTTIQPIPGGKGDLNNGGLVSTDAIGLGHGWAEADDAARAALWADHQRWVAGVLYFLTTEPSVPAGLQAEARSWGLCPDEFPTTGGWPPQLYIREARRMVAPVVLTQHDVLGGAVHPDPVAIGSYRLDVHSVQRVLDAGGYVRGEGGIDGRPPPYHIPLGSILPDRREAENLIVPVAISASHVAWASMRMEPVFLQLGESAGVLAALAAERGTAVQDVPYVDLRTILEEQGSRLGVVGR